MLPHAGEISKGLLSSMMPDRARERPLYLDLLAGQLAALARLGALRDLDLQLVRVGQVHRAHAEAPARDLRRACAHKLMVSTGSFTGLTGPRSHRIQTGL